MYIESVINSSINNISKQDNKPGNKGKTEKVPKDTTDNTKEGVRFDKGFYGTLEGSDAENRTNTEQNMTKRKSVYEELLKSNEEKAKKEAEQEKREALKEALKNTEVKFGIHEKTDRITIKMVDAETKEIIKEFPPEKNLEQLAKCLEVAGVILDKKL